MPAIKHADRHKLRILFIAISLFLVLMRKRASINGLGIGKGIRIPDYSDPEYIFFIDARDMQIPNARNTYEYIASTLGFY